MPFKKWNIVERPALKLRSAAPLNLIVRCNKGGLRSCQQQCLLKFKTNNREQKQLESKVDEIVENAIFGCDELILVKKDD